MRLFDPLFGWGTIDKLFSERSTVQRMLDFEAALARAEGKTGVIPAAAAKPIASKCQVGLFDLDELAKACAQSGNLAIPLVKQLTALVAASDDMAARYVHWGATSQDVIDTAVVLQLRDALAHIEADLLHCSELLKDLALKHRRTPLAGRTWMQHAAPIVLGLKFAGWRDVFERHLARLREARPRCLVLQFGGAAGSLASLNENGNAVQQALAAELNLEAPPLPWHAHRDRLAEIACVLGLLAGSLGKIARDISLLGQTEIAELMEPCGEGRGGSSAMPQKRNPVSAAVILSASMRAPGLVSAILTAMVQENERGLGGWHAEWETLPELVRIAASALHHLAAVIEKLEIHPDEMLRNLDITHGLIHAEALSMALAPHIGKTAAHQVIESCAQQALLSGEPLRDIARKNKDVTDFLTPEKLEELFAPLSDLGATDEFIDRAVGAHEESGRFQS